jgi:hypothetical protein
MARGWESKSVEALAGVAEVHQGAVPENSPDPEKLDRLRKRESLLLSRTRVVRDLNAARNPRYIEILNKALADLDAQISVIR